MKISAEVKNSQGSHEVMLTTDDNQHSLTILPRPTGYGSSANGGELLFLALATCYCNDVYREAAKRKIQVEQVEVTVEGDFGAEGEPAKNVTYRSTVTAQASQEEIVALMRAADSLAEIQNTLRLGAPVELADLRAVTAHAPSSTPGNLKA